MAHIRLSSGFKRYIASPRPASTRYVWCKNHRAASLNSRDISRRSLQADLDFEHFLDCSGDCCYWANPRIERGRQRWSPFVIRGFYPVETWDRLHIGACSFIRESTCRARKNQPDPFIAPTLLLLPLDIDFFPPCASYSINNRFHRRGH